MQCCMLQIWGHYTWIACIQAITSSRLWKLGGVEEGEMFGQWNGCVGRSQKTRLIKKQLMPAWPQESGIDLIATNKGLFPICALDNDVVKRHRDGHRRSSPVVIFSLVPLTIIHVRIQWTSNNTLMIFNVSSPKRANENMRHPQRSTEHAAYAHGFRHLFGSRRREAARGSQLGLAEDDGQTWLQAGLSSSEPHEHVGLQSWRHSPEHPGIQFLSCRCWLIYIYYRLIWYDMIRGCFKRMWLQRCPKVTNHRLVGGSDQHISAPLRTLWNWEEDPGWGNQGWCVLPKAIWEDGIGNLDA